jgi:hypothetical protein
VAVCANCQLKLLLNGPSISPVGAMPSNAPLMRPNDKFPDVALWREAMKQRAVVRRALDLGKNCAVRRR